MTVSSYKPIPYAELAAAIDATLKGKVAKGDDKGLTVEEWKSALSLANVDGHHRWGLDRARRWVVARLADGTLVAGTRSTMSRLGDRRVNQRVYGLAPKGGTRAKA